MLQMEKGVQRPEGGTEPQVMIPLHPQEFDRRSFYHLLEAAEGQAREGPGHQD